MTKKAIHASGKRKHSIARATLRQGNGKIRINNQLLDYYGNELSRTKIMEPLILVGKDIVSQVDIDVNLRGGGITSGTEAARLAISRALVEYAGKKTFKDKLLQYDRNLLVADVRRNEPHKPNDSKPRAKRQKSYR